MRRANASAESAALLMLAAKGSPPLSHTVRARAKKDTGGSAAILCAMGKGSFVSRYGTVKLLAISVRRTIASRKRAACEMRRKSAAGITAISSPATAKTAKKLKALAVNTATAWPRLNLIHTAKEFCEPTTAMGNRTSEAAFTTTVKRAARAKTADKLATKMARSETGRGTRLV